MQDHDRVIVKTSVCVERIWRTVHRHSPVWLSVSPQLIKLLIYTLTLPRVDIRGHMGVKSFVVCLVFLVSCPALSFSALLLGGPVSSSHTVTPTLRRPCTPFLSVISLCLHSKSNSSPKNISLLRLHILFLDVRQHIHSFTHSCLVGYPQHSFVRFVGMLIVLLVK